MTDDTSGSAEPIELDLIESVDSEPEVIESRPSTLSYLVFIIIAIVSMILGVFNVAWDSTSSEVAVFGEAAWGEVNSTRSALIVSFSLCSLDLLQRTGLFIEVLFLDWVLLHAHGAILFLCLGLKSSLFAPVTALFASVIQ